MARDASAVMGSALLLWLAARPMRWHRPSATRKKLRPPQQAEETAIQICAKLLSRFLSRRVYSICNLGEKLIEMPLLFDRKIQKLGLICMA